MTNLSYEGADTSGGSGRDATLFQDVCKLSGKVPGTSSVTITPTREGIKAQIQSDQGVVLQDVLSKDCE